MFSHLINWVDFAAPLNEVILTLLSIALVVYIYQLTQYGTLSKKQLEMYSFAKKWLFNISIKFVLIPSIVSVCLNVASISLLNTVSCPLLLQNIAIIISAMAVICDFSFLLVVSDPKYLNDLKDNLAKRNDKFDNKN